MMLTGCGSGALKYNDSIVKIMNTFQPPVKTFFEKVGAVQDGDYSTLNAEAKKIETMCNGKLTDLSAIAEFKGGEKLRGAVKDEIEFVRKAVQFIQKMGDKSLSEDERTTAQNQFVAHAQTGALLDKVLEDTQKDFAKEHGFKIDPNKVVE
jgi:hypothetical protein